MSSQALKIVVKQMIVASRPQTLTLLRIPLNLIKLRLRTIVTLVRVLKTQDLMSQSTTKLSSEIKQKLERVNNQIQEANKSGKALTIHHRIRLLLTPQTPLIVLVGPL